MVSDAQKRAQKKYDEANRDRYVNIRLKLNKETDMDVINQLQYVDNKNGYIKELIRQDIEGGN